MGAPTEDQTTTPPAEGVIRATPAEIIVAESTLFAAPIAATDRWTENLQTNSDDSRMGTSVWISVRK
jgi:hypothetical protein